MTGRPSRPVQPMQVPVGSAIYHVLDTLRSKDVSSWIACCGWATTELCEVVVAAAGDRAPASMNMTVGGAKDDVLHTLFVEHVGERVSSRLRQAGHAGEIYMAHLPRELFVAKSAR